ncbi:hypothetical protein DFH28DRAFT_244196 [Melampsora americana]|nr:hypothetical protein DFH28DRAFT_244196 [Melampsora americana]
MHLFLIFFPTLLVWISTLNFIKGSGTSDGHVVSRYASQLFEKCEIKDSNLQVSILEKSKKDFNEKILKFDKENMEPESQSWSLEPSEPKSNILKSKLNLNFESLSHFTLKRQKGYIVFEDGENDDYLQNYLSYLYDDRIPEMIIISKGYSKLRLKMCQKFWEIISIENKCEIPKILIGSQGKKEIQIFDIMEGVGVIEEFERQKLIEDSLDIEKREIEARKTFQLVANHILTLNEVSIALKTAPTDLYEIVKLLGLKIAREKMIIGWAAPAGFVEKPNSLHLYAKFNFEQDYEASYELISSGIPMYLTGKSLSDTHTKALIAKEHAIKMREIDEKFNAFEGFENLIETFESIPVGDFLHLYLNIQRGFQDARVYFAKKTIQYLNELSTKPHHSEEIVVDQEALKSKFAVEYFEKVKYKLKGILESYSNQDEMENKIEQLKQKQENIIERWESLFRDEKYFIEGCIADLHLEFVLNSNLRNQSLKEIIPVKLSKKLNNDLQDIHIEIQPDSHCWLISEVDDTHFVEILQDFINKSNKKNLNFNTHLKF